MDKDYGNFVARMGSFEMDFEELRTPEDEKELKHYGRGTHMEKNYRVTRVGSDELAHFGVLGMKWGKSRTGGSSKQLAKSDLRKNFDAKKIKKKDAQAEYNDAFDAVWYKGGFGRQADRRQDRMMKTMNKSIKADTEFKTVKTERKTAIKDRAKKLEADTSTKEKLLYNHATRKRAAKYVVDNNMSVTDAKKRANEDAIRNTVALLAVYGAVSAVGLYKINH